MLSPEQSQHLNVREGLGRIRGNQTVYKSLLMSFANKDYVQQLEEEIQRGDMEAAAKTAHSIKGIASNLSMPLLLRATVDMEQRIKAGEQVQECIGEYLAVAEKTQQAVAAALEIINRGDSL